MVIRKRITLLYNYNESWIAGSYYIQNIIKALNVLDEEKKPFLSVLHPEGCPLDELVSIQYPYITFVSYPSLPLSAKIINRVSNFIIKRPVWKNKLSNEKITHIYPFELHFRKTNINQPYMWIPDFQERYLPTYFHPREVSRRKRLQSEIVRNRYPVVFSSYNAQSDFDNFYPGNLNPKTVLHFASIVGRDYQLLNILDLKQKFGIDKPYFIVTNQFWKHKNHFTVIKAFKLLLDKHFDYQLVLTGKISDYRNPDYIEEIAQYLKQPDLVGRVITTGFIKRNEQLKLMEAAMAIIQPSLFEGWSTVVEDAKALNKLILVSDIPIHREQINHNCAFFEPTDERALQMLMTEVSTMKITSADGENFTDVRAFAERFLEIFA
ncbi:glycosyltransferase [Chitinophaga sp. 30R24]|uniref:glycosyltransferase n=1 Tax=Chitinophaga sp. 30R24 TaxID=3248838 RepID=UPI003B920CF6